MRITALERARAGKAYRLYIDGELTMEVSNDLVHGRNLHEGEEITAGHLRILRDLQAKDTAYRTALRLLGYRPRSERELRRRLHLKGMTARAVEPTIQRLRRAGLLDDATFARFYVESRQRASARSRNLIRYELQAKGIGSEAVLAATAHLDDEESAYKVAARRASRLENGDRAKSERRLAAFLASRGFGYGAIQRTLARLKESPAT